MLHTLSTAAPPSTSDSSAYFMLVAGGVLAAVCILTGLIMFFSRARRHRRSEILTVAAFFWAILTAGLLLRTVIQQLSWSQNVQTNLATGYYSPDQAAADQPAIPWLLGGILGLVYLVLLIITFLGKPKEKPDA